MIRQIDPNRLRLGSDSHFLRVVGLDACLGALLGIALATVILWLDLGGLRTLLFSSDTAAAATLLFFFGFAATFSGAVCSTALMNAPADDDDDTDGGLLVPIPVRSGRRTPRG